MRIRAIRINMILVLAVCSIAIGLPACGDTESGAMMNTYAVLFRHSVVSPQISITLSGDGEIIAAALGKDKIKRSVHGQTSLAGFTTSGKVAVKKLSNGGVEFQRTLKSDNQTQKCTLIDRFVPTKNSIRWEIEISGDDSPWTTTINTGLHYPASGDVKFWTAWSDPDQSAETTGWNDPLVSMPLKDMKLWYGAYPFEAVNPCMWWIPFQHDIFGMPLATFVEEKTDIGLSLVLSLEDMMREISLNTTAQGDLTFARYKHRLGGGKTVKFAMDIVAHEADWRGGLRWMSHRYPEFFDPPNQKADEIGGCAAYSSYTGDLDAEKLRKMGFTVNWRASWLHPYQGMEMPPVPNETDEWAAIYTEGFYDGRKVSRKAMNDYSAMMRRYGFHVLDYYNVAEYGKHVNGLNPPDNPDGNVPWTNDYKQPIISYTVSKDIPEDKLWENSMDYLVAKISDGILFHPNGTIYYENGENAIAMDPGGPNYQAHLLEQAKRLIDKVPESDGICIDRLDMFVYYNPNADDGESWMDGRPVRSLLWSWKDLFEKLGPMMHSAGKVIFVNNHTKRIEMLKHIDGVYDEFTYSGEALNLTAFNTLRKPAIGWTSGEDDFRADPDAYFQRFLYLGTFITVPYPENDHSILPSEFAEKWYLDYGPLFTQMRGRKWVLEPHVVTADSPTVKVNLFEVPGGYSMPVMFGGKAGSATVTIQNVSKLEKSLSQYTCQALHPGSEKWVPVKASVSGKKVVLRVPLKQGCAMVRFSKKAH